MPRTIVTVLLVALEVALGLTAVEGGVWLLRDPSGGRLHLTKQALAASPFTDFFWPGLILLVFVGVLPLVVAALSAVRRPWSDLLHLVPGALLTGFMLAQLRMMGVLHPSQLAALALGLLLLSLAVGRLALEERPSAGPAWAELFPRPSAPRPSGPRGL